MRLNSALHGFHASKGTSLRVIDGNDSLISDIAWDRDEANIVPHVAQTDEAQPFMGESHWPATDRFQLRPGLSVGIAAKTAAIRLAHHLHRSSHACSAYQTPNQ